jgi:type II secretory pathway pseudopilin PulG
MQRRQRSDCWGGFSLVEVLLTLGLLAAVAALAWPEVRRQFDNYRLRTASDMIRTEWCLARIEAIRTGCVYTFRRSGDGNHFSTQRESDDMTAPAAPQAQSQSQWQSPSPSTPSYAAPQAAAAAAPQSVEKTLPEGVEFMMIETAPDAAAGAEALEGSPDAVSPDWSEPIFFYPDGTTSDAQLTLKNDQGRSVQMDLHGLTGTVDVGDILSGEE